MGNYVKKKIVNKMNIKKVNMKMKEYDGVV